MNEKDTLTLTISQDLTSGQVSVQANKPLSFNVALRLQLIALKGLKDNLLDKVLSLPAEELNVDTQEEACKIMEGEMYDSLNIAVGNFLDSEFPRVNLNPSLTEAAALEAGLDRNASREELLDAENALIDKDPKAAAKYQELQPQKVKTLPRKKK